MKIAISANSVNPESQFSSRFARCSYFLITDPAAEVWEELPNTAADAPGGAGAQVVQLLADHGVDVVISGRYGPTAFEALQAAGIEAYLAKSGTPRELVSQFQEGHLTAASGPTGEGFHGGGGRHGGRGHGRRW